MEQAAGVPWPDGRVRPWVPNKWQTAVFGYIGCHVRLLLLSYTRFTATQACNTRNCLLCWSTTLRRAPSDLKRSGYSVGVAWCDQNAAGVWAVRDLSAGPPNKSRAGMEYGPGRG